MVAFEITTWHPVMIISLVGTLLVYVASVPFLGGYFDLGFMLTLYVSSLVSVTELHTNNTRGFAWRVAAISAISLIPPYSAKLIRRAIKPPNYRKVQGI
jgi:phospholipid-translocating ATPase